MKGRRIKVREETTHPWFRDMEASYGPEKKTEYKGPAKPGKEQGLRTKVSGVVKGTFETKEQDKTGVERICRESGQQLEEGNKET